MKYKNRHRLKQKEVGTYVDELVEKLGDSPFKPEDPVDRATLDKEKVILVGEKVLAAFFGGEIFPTINGLLKMSPKRSHVTVDMGAVRFVYNGADIMAPGIVDADLSIEEGDLVWVRDEDHGKPLAVGRAMTDGETMVRSDSGKVIKSLHHVGDGLYG